MSRAELLYLAPDLFSLLLFMEIFLYARGHRYIRGARAFSWLMAGQILAGAGFTLELISPDLQTKIIWDTFQWLTTAFLVILPFFVFAIQFSEQKSYSAFFLGLVLTFLVVFASLLLTDHIHHLFSQNPRLIKAGPFSELAYDFTPVIYIHLVLYVYGANLYGITLLVRHAFQRDNLFREQSLMIARGFLLPLIASLFTLADTRLAPQQYVMPLATSIGDLVAAWALFRYGWLDIAPLARVQIIEKMDDPAIVMDPKKRIIDINQAALRLIGKQGREVIGKIPEIAFPTIPFLIEFVETPFEQRKEVSTMRDSKPLFFDIAVSHLLDQRRRLLGRIITVREVTKLKTLEADYQNVSKELEQRIQKRTEEMHQTAIRYRAIVEDHADFIVRWKPDGTRTFVNEAYCRYWGMTYEQALAVNFLFHALEEDRPEVEEKIARLNSGESDLEVEIHRVVKPDGSVA